MTREQKVSTLIQYLKQENQGYASIPDPIDEGEQRRLLRSLMNVRYPGHVSAEYEKLQDELLQEEAEEKGKIRGETQGRIQAQLDMLQVVMRKFGKTADEAMDMLEIAPERRESYKEKLQERALQ